MISSCFNRGKERTFIDNSSDFYENQILSL